MNPLHKDFWWSKYLSLFKGYLLSQHTRRWLKDGHILQLTRQLYFTNHRKNM
jgi:hypothetical protein